MPTAIVDKLPRSAKRGIALAVDVILCLLTVQLAYWLRLSEWIVPTGNQWASYALAPVLAIPILSLWGLYSDIFRSAGWATLSNLAKGTLCYLLIYASIFTAFGIDGIPRTIGVIQPILLLMAIGGSRAAARALLSGYHSGRISKPHRRAVIFGAGAAGRQLEAAFREGRYGPGAVAAVIAVGDLLAGPFPAGPGNPDELPDRPVRL